jgi:hypothetical protein
MLHSSFLKDIGLLEGKMGVAIFFFHYAIYTKRSIYSDFGGELIDEICDEIHISDPLNFRNGLAGIAWGIEYLIQKKFVMADSDEILDDLDRRILEWDVRRITDISAETGLIGLAYYVISRNSNKEKRIRNTTDEYISDLISSLKPKMSSKKQNYQVIEYLDTILSGGQIQNKENPLYLFYKNNNYKDDSSIIENCPLGIINNGLAGIGLNLMRII